MPTILSLDHCSYAYRDGAFRLSDVSLEIVRGRLCGIIGPNGSGKSTLLRIMAGITRPDAGRVHIVGRAMQHYSRRELARQVAFLPQNPSPSYDLSVRDVVALGRYPHQGALGLTGSNDRAVVERTLRDTECTGLADRCFSTLSGGERQRVLVASILAQEPSVLLLDEPGAALDIHHKSHVFDLLWALSRQDIAVVIVTHDLNMAAGFCDELILLDSGRIEETGAPGRVMRDELLSRVYRASLRVIAHPLTGLPMVDAVGRKMG